MRGSASEIEPNRAHSRTHPRLGVCPTLSRLWPRRGTAKMRVDWILVSPVPPVSPSLKLINEYRMGNEGRQQKAINWRSAPNPGTGGTGATVAGLCGETTGARHR